jgi:hypothetical protein
MWKLMQNTIHHISMPYYQDEVAIYSIEPIELISGALPRRQQRLVEAWIELNYQTIGNSCKKVENRSLLLH